MHQDMLSQKFCGEGVPNWMNFKKLPFEFVQFPWPVKKALTKEEKDDKGFPVKKACSDSFP